MGSPDPPELPEGEAKYGGFSRFDIELEVSSTFPALFC
jgi:hypothetical protein